MSVTHKEVGAGGRWVSGKGVGSNSSSLVMSEGFSAAWGLILMAICSSAAEGDPAAGTLWCVGVPAWKIGRVCPGRRVET